MNIPFLPNLTLTNVITARLVNRTEIYKVRSILERSHISNTILYTFYLMCVCVKYQMCMSQWKSQVYSSMSYTLFQYDTGKWLKFKILQYNQVPIFNSSFFQYFLVFPVSVATLFWLEQSELKKLKCFIWFLQWRLFKIIIRWKLINLHSTDC